MEIELTRVELPVKEGHRGRKPCEWRIGDFVVPKSLHCSECDLDKATTKDGFVALLQKTKLAPEKLVKKYICRSCRAGMKRNDEVVKIGRFKEEPVSEDEVVSGPQKISDKINGIKRLGVVVKGKKVRFCILAEDAEKPFISTRCLALADEVHDLRLRVCLKHRRENGCFDGGKFITAPMYDAKDMGIVMDQIISGELKV